MYEKFWDSIILITSNDTDFSGNFGTGFVIHQDEQITYVLTCAHVVEEVGGAGKVKVDGYPATEVALGDRYGCDLAVLAVKNGLTKLPPLKLDATGEKGREFIVSGFYTDGTKTRKLAPISGKLGGTQIIVDTEGDRTLAWNLEISDDNEHELKAGYSGSPVVDKASGYVLGVVAQLISQGKGLAISIEALKKVWQEPKKPLNPPPPEFIEIPHTVRCIVKNYSGLIPVENTLQMSRQDMSRYISAQSPNLQAWVENGLEKIIKPLLLSKRYIDILTDFHQEDETIRTQMKNAAETIGYKVQHIVSIPRLEHLDLKADFEIVDEDQQFTTNVASIEVKLSTTVNAKFENFDKVEYYLNSSVDEIIEEMRKVVYNKTKEILRKTQPERFYTQFFLAEEGQVSLEEELKEKITKALEDRFGVTVLSVVPITEDTPIIEYVQRLLGMSPGTFECEILSASGAEPIKLGGEFKIEGIRPGQWHVFLSKFLSMQQSQEPLRQELEALKADYADLISLRNVQVNRVEIETMSRRISTIENELSGIEKIRKCVEESINTNLSFRYESPRLIYTFIRDKNEEIDKWARESVVDQYGLEISIRNVDYRIPNRLE